MKDISRKNRAGGAGERPAFFFADKGGKAFTAAVLLIALSAPIAAGDIPYRDILIGGDQSPASALSIPFQRYHISIDGLYRDIYYRNSPSEYHDYHQGRIGLTALSRRGSFILGFKTGRDLLSLEQDNVYTDSDRLRGERERRSARLILGFDAPGEGVPGGGFISGFEAAGSIGGENGGFAASLEGRATLAGMYSLSLGMETFPTEVELYESMLGYRFPFHFPFRTSTARFRAAIPFSGAALSLRGRLGENRGDGEEISGFRNTVGNFEYGFGATVSQGAEFSEDGRRFLGGTESASGTWGLALSFDRKVSGYDISMYNQGIRYANLEDFKAYNEDFRLYAAPFPSAWIFVGWEGFRFKHGARSFFESWPFTVWSYFTAEKYVLGDAEGNIDIWYGGAGAFVDRGRFSLDITGRFEIIEDRGEYAWYNREWPVFPLIPDYVRHDEDLRPHRTYAVQFSPRFQYLVGGGLIMRLYMDAFIPFGRERIGGEETAGQGGGTPNGGGGGSRTHGGLTGGIALEYSM